ncbi:hypothetical protein V498_08276, partial [Pseudogymnoascus sp. VKM F-4517 (FW-2822)]
MLFPPSSDSPIFVLLTLNPTPTKHSPPHLSAAIFASTVAAARGRTQRDARPGCYLSRGAARGVRRRPRGESGLGRRQTGGGNRQADKQAGRQVDEQAAQGGRKGRDEARWRTAAGREMSCRAMWPRGKTILDEAICLCAERVGRGNSSRNGGGGKRR